MARLIRNRTLSFPTLKALKAWVKDKGIPKHHLDGKAYRFRRYEEDSSGFGKTAWYWIDPKGRTYRSTVANPNYDIAYHKATIRDNNASYGSYYLHLPDEPNWPSDYDREARINEAMRNDKAKTIATDPRFRLWIMEVRVAITGSEPTPVYSWRSTQVYKKARPNSWPKVGDVTVNKDGTWSKVLAVLNNI